MSLTLQQRLMLLAEGKTLIDRDGSCYKAEGSSILIRYISPGEWKHGGGKWIDNNEIAPFTVYTEPQQTEAERFKAMYLKIETEFEYSEMSIADRAKQMADLLLQTFALKTEASKGGKV